MRVFTLTLDDAFNNTNVVGYLTLQLQLFRKDLFHIRCACHIINLIVQEDLKIVGPMLNNIRDTLSASLLHQ